jgi:cell division protein FtsB
MTQPPQLVLVWLVRAIGAVALLAAYSLLFGPYGIQRFVDMRRNVHERSERAYERIQANASLEERLDALQNDPRTVDTELRSANWVRPGEVMIVLPPKQ